MADDDELPPEDSDPERRAERNRFQRLGDQLHGLLDPEAAFRRGSGIVSGASKATRDELMRIVGVEVRRFLDKMDIADLAQQIVEGLVVDVHMQVKFSRDQDKKLQPTVTSSDVRVNPEAAEAGPPKGSPTNGSKNG